jgi:hypothetical protein
VIRYEPGREILERLVWRPIDIDQCRRMLQFEQSVSCNLRSSPPSLSALALGPPLEPPGCQCSSVSACPAQCYSVSACNAPQLALALGPPLEPPGCPMLLSHRPTTRATRLPNAPQSLAHRSSHQAAQCSSVTSAHHSSLQAAQCSSVSLQAAQMHLSQRLPCPMHLSEPRPLPTTRRCGRRPCPRPAPRQRSTGGPRP